MPAPSLIAFKQGVGISRKRGTYVLVGLPLFPHAREIRICALSSSRSPQRLPVLKPE